MFRQAVARTLAQGMDSALAVVDTTTETQASDDVLVFPYWFLAIAGALTALFFAWRFYSWMIAQDEGDELMVSIAERVRAGAKAYLDQQYRVVTMFFAATMLVLLFVTFVLKTQSEWVPFAFLTGGLFSGLAGWFGMKTATLASARTSQAVKGSLNDGLKVAFRSGAVMGLVVVGLALLDICIWFAVLRWIGGEGPAGITVTMLCFGMGASAQALFARVGGGIFTKAADVGADLVGKVDYGIDEDDPRNPATIADNVGDNVGDVAGMGADLYESYTGSILASAALGVAAFHGMPRMQFMALLLPMVLAGFGIVVSIGGIHIVKTKNDADQKDLLKALARGIDGASVVVSLVAAGLVYFMLVMPSNAMAEQLESAGLPHGNSLFGVLASVVIGLAAGVGIGKWTEYSTSDHFKPTRRIADQAQTGPATVIIAGIAEGLYSVWVPIIVVCAAILLSFGFCTGFEYREPHLFAFGLYGVAISAVGMLSTLGITLATDAYGPIADNAGGNAQMSNQDPMVRERTDALDSLGNTTAATGKGFAIGSAALTAMALLAAYVEEVKFGFERWAENTIELPYVEDASQASLLKLRDRVFAYREGAAPATAADGEDGAAEGHPQVLLVFSSAAPAHQELLRTLAEVPKGKTIDGIDIEMMMQNEIAVNNEMATIPDFGRFYDAGLLNPRVLVGVLLGVMLAFVFCAMTMKAVGRAANIMAEEVRRQFREDPGILEGTSEPDHARCVAISTTSAQREMTLPAILGIVAPLAVGLLLGVAGVIGMLVGGLASGFGMAIMMANSGGAWDNAKKYVESGHLGGKGTDVHKATVVGDTVGDPFKDTSGPSLNILIKLMSMVSVVFAGLVVRYSLMH